MALSAKDKKDISEIIRLTVNGKIDKIQENLNEHNIKHEDDMKRILPIVEAFEAAGNSGRFVAKVGALLIALGTIWIMGKQILYI